MIRIKTWNDNNFVFIHLESFYDANILSKIIVRTEQHPMHVAVLQACIVEVKRKHALFKF